MAIKGYFFNAIRVGDSYDRTYNAEDFASYLAKLVSNGVFASPASSLQVISDSGLKVIVKAGEGWINGHKMVNTADMSLTIESADVILNRKDFVIFYLDYINREMGIEVKKGTPAQSPAAPDLIRNTSRYELALAEITLAKGQTSVTSSSIKDVRGYGSLCGYVRSLIDSTDATTLFNQWNGQFNEWWSSVKQILNTESKQFGVASFKGRGGTVTPQAGDYIAEEINYDRYSGLDLKEVIDGKIDSNGGDLTNAVLKTIENITTSYPVPSAGDKGKTFLGKIVKFFNDIKTWMTSVVLKSNIVNNTTSTRTDMPLSAKQGKVLSGRINPLETFLSGKTYRQFAAKPADWLGSGMISVAVVDISGSKFSNCPPTRSGSLAYYIVLTIGVSGRCCQIAFYGFSGATVDKGSIFFRRQHDSDVSGWQKVF